MKRIDDYIGGINEKLLQPFNITRDIIIKNFPNLEESIKWNVPVYHKGSKNICFLAANKNHITFGFYKGSLLENAAELEGTGNTVRHLKIKTKEDIDETFFCNLIYNAVLLEGVV